jgi:undecaprenyl diphosphate synthase
MLSLPVPGFARKLYEKRLEKDVIKGFLPEHIMVVTEDVEIENHVEKFRELITWCFKLGIKEITLCIHVSGKRNYKEFPDRILGEVRRLNGGNLNINLITPDEFIENGDGDYHLNLIVGYGGRVEITDAIKKMAELVERGEIRSEEICEEDVEKYLKIKNSPDLIIKAGEDIPDFLIWQSIYSELYFLDIGWSDMRYIDFLRCLRGYQKRERRFGK